VAIIDRGRLVASGPVTELARGDRQVMVGCDDPARAAALLRGQRAVARVAHDTNGFLVVTPAQGTAIAQLNRSLVEAGIGVDRLEPVQATLEQRFLEITAHLEAAK
jgi:ABC-type multidrug transport system ATPase subunit